MKWTKGLAGFAIVGALLIPVSCSIVADCARICKDYSECITNIDVTECTDLCEDRAEADPAIEDAAKRCEDCLDAGNACAEDSVCLMNADCQLAVVVTED